MDWPDEARLEAVRARIKTLQGDRAESFHGFSTVSIREKLKILLQMSAVLTYGAARPIVKVGRIAAQFAKARSAPNERIGDLELPSFRGHLMHSEELPLMDMSKSGGV